MVQTLPMPSHMKSHIGLQLEYVDLTLTDSKDQDSGHVHFGREYL